MTLNNSRLVSNGIACEVTISTFIDQSRFSLFRAVVELGLNQSSAQVEDNAESVERFLETLECDLIVLIVVLDRVEVVDGVFSLENTDCLIDSSDPLHSLDCL